MRILVCEFVTGGGLRESDLPESLVREGDLMLQALVKDLMALPGLEIWTTRDDRLPGAPAGVKTTWIRGGRSIWSTLEQLLSSVEIFWPIAPESGGALERLCRLARETGCRSIASDPSTLALTASKVATTDHLAHCGLPTVATWRTGQVDESPTGWVVKPDDGAGCEETRYFTDHRALCDWLGLLPPDHGFVIQSYVPGTPASLSLLCRDGKAWLLACNRQRITLQNATLHYEGSEVAALEAARPRFEPIAEAIAESMPGLWGYIGVDLIDTANGPRVLEVNPRMTTSYVALGQSIGVNPAGLVLSLLEHAIEQIRRPLKPASTPVSTAHV